MYFYLDSSSAEPETGKAWMSLVKFFLDVFVTLFVIIDPAGTVPVLW